MLTRRTFLKLAGAIATRAGLGPLQRMALAAVPLASRSFGFPLTFPAAFLEKKPKGVFSYILLFFAGNE